MGKQPAKITLSPSRDIPFDQLVLSQSNVRRIKAGVSIPELAEDIARRTLLQSLNVRPVLDEAGVETGMFEVPAGGRRYRALELLVKQKRLARTALVPCIVKSASSDISAEEDSYAENAVREQLHPLDQFRAMQAMVDKGSAVEDIAAYFGVTPAVVRQRLKLASVSPGLCEIYADDGMSLEQLMAFTVSDDHARQAQVWEMLAHSYNKSAAYIRQRLTENNVRVADKRVRFVTIDAYVAAGGGVMRDLFEDDDGGWLTDPALLDTLVAAKLRDAGEAITAEGWKWVATAVDMPWAVTNGHREISGIEVPMSDEAQVRLAALQSEIDGIEAQWAEERDVPQDVYDRLDALNAEIGKLSDRPLEFDPTDVALAGVFVSIERDGSLCVERGYVRPEDEPAAEPVPDGIEHETGAAEGGVGSTHPVGTDSNGASATDDDDEADEGLKPLPDRLVADLTAWRTLALQDALAQSPTTAFAAVLHALVLQTCYFASRESCLQIAIHDVSFANPPSGLRDSAPARSLAERARYWEERLPESDADLWEALLALNGDDQAALFAHCASLAVNAQCEIVPKYDNGRVSKHSIERRLAHSHVLAHAVGLDLVAAGWRPTVDGYFRSVTKPRILADVTEARGEQFAGMIDHLKKGDMAREAERLLEDAQWLPEPLRTPPAHDGDAGAPDCDALPAFLDEDDSAYAIAAE
jgi:ParB family chromosome partitioning protein